MNTARKIKETGTIKRRPGSRRPVTAMTEQNGNLLGEMILSRPNSE